MNSETDTAEVPAYDGEIVERIEKKDLKPLWDADHTHEYTRDESEETEEWYGMMCKECPTGFLVSKLEG